MSFTPTAGYACGIGFGGFREPKEKKVLNNVFTRQFLHIFQLVLIRIIRRQLTVLFPDFWSASACATFFRQFPRFMGAPGFMGITRLNVRDPWFFIWRTLSYKRFTPVIYEEPR